MPWCVPTDTSDPRANLVNQLFVIGIQPAHVKAFLVEAQHVRAGDPVACGGKSQPAHVLDNPALTKPSGTHHPLKIDQMQIEMAVARDHEDVRKVIVFVDETCVVESSGKRRESGNQRLAAGTIVRSPEHVRRLSVANLHGHYKAANGPAARRNFSGRDRRCRANASRAQRV